MPFAGWIGRFMRGRPPNNSPRTSRRPRFSFERRLSGLFGRWIGCQRPFPAAADDDFAAGKCEPRL